MPNQKKTGTQYCDGCLSTDRYLGSINNYRDIYLKILRDDLKKSNNILNKDPLMCWECLAMLRNAQKFKQTVIKAQEFLSANNVKKSVKVSSTLSTLTSYINTEQILQIYEEEKHIIDEKTKNNKSFDVVKEEYEKKQKSEVKVINDLKQEYSAVNHEICQEPEIYIEQSDDIDGFKIKEEDYNIVNEEAVHMSDTDSSSTVEEKDLTNNTQFHIDQEKSKGDKSKSETRIKKMSLKPKYKIVFLRKDEKNKMDVLYKKIKNISENEMRQWKRKEVNARIYQGRPYKCSLCLQGYGQEITYQQHLLKWHSESSGSFQCDICHKRFSRKDSMMFHIRDHYSKYRCLLCGHETYHLWQIYSHHEKAHRRMVLCLICGMKFQRRAEFNKHYTDLHGRMICDYCGKTKCSKQWLIRHIRRNHGQHKCDACGRLYSSANTLHSHKVLVHLKAPTEDTYCVECDIQFDNITRYKRHMKTSIKHVTIAGVPCPECGKVYRKKSTMNNHFNQVHLKKTKHFCVECSRYFLNGYQYRRHIATIHEKIRAAKNKMCSYCGRGFSTNNILVNHIRTHTGERPFVCDVCSASFGQKHALVTHRRCVHKLVSKSTPTSKL